MISLDSSNLSGAEYNPWSGTLIIAFHSGGVYAYYAVPSSKFTALLNASSHGKYFHAEIKPYYSYRRLR